MNYQEFKDHLITFLWRPNDSVLAASLDNLIVMGTSELNRTLDISDRTHTELVSVTGNMFDLSALTIPFRSMKSVGPADSPAYTKDYGYSLTTYAHIQQLRNQGGFTTWPYYHLMNTKGAQQLHFAGVFTNDDVDNIYIEYRTALPDFSSLDASWLADDYLDLYTYTVLSHAAPFLREDDRIATWVQLKTAALAGVLEDDAFNIEYGGSPLKQRMPRNPPRRHRY